MYNRQAKISLTGKCEPRNLRFLISDKISDVTHSALSHICKNKNLLKINSESH